VRHWSEGMDGGKESTDRLFGLRKRAATGKHALDRLCSALGPDLETRHRLSPPMHPQTNAKARRFNGRIEDVLQSHHFRSGEELDTTLHRYVLLFGSAASTGGAQKQNALASDEELAQTQA